MRVRTSGPAVPLTCYTNLSVAGAKRYDQFAEVGEVCALVLRRRAPDAVTGRLGRLDGVVPRVEWRPSPATSAVR